MDKIRLTPHILDQQNILYWGRQVGYCGTKPYMPICWLIPRECRLTDDEKREVVAFVIDKLGSIKPTPQTLPYLPPSTVASMIRMVFDDVSRQPGQSS